MNLLGFAGGDDFSCMRPPYPDIGHGQVFKIGIAVSRCGYTALIGVPQSVANVNHIHKVKILVYHLSDSDETVIRLFSFVHGSVHCNRVVGGKMGHLGLTFCDICGDILVWLGWGGLTGWDGLHF